MILKIPKLQVYFVLAVVVRELSEAPECFLFDCCIFIVRFVSLSCYSLEKTRICWVKSYQLKRIIGYLTNFPHGSLRFRTHEPDYANLPHKDYDWQRTVHSGAKEEVPHDIPEPKGKHVATTTYVGADLHHDEATGRVLNCG